MAATTQLSMSRLERLFSRRRVSLIQTPRIAEQLHVLPDAPDQEPLFPSPSFIKPTVSRMVAREEIAIVVKSPSRANLHNATLQKPESTHVVSPTRKSPNSRNSICSGSSRSTIVSYISTSTSPSTVCSSEYTTRYSTCTISSRRPTAAIPRLTFQLSSSPDPSHSDTPPTPFSPDFGPRPSFCSELSINSYFDGGKLDNFPHPPRPETPPPTSEADETRTIKQPSSPPRSIAPPKKRVVRRGPAPDFSAFSFPTKNDTLSTTPRQSHKMAPRRSLPPVTLPPHQITNRIMVSNPEPPMRYMYNGLRRSSSVSGAEQMLKAPKSLVRPKTSASVDGILSEPTVHDFMHLADDDIAEEDIQAASTTGPTGSTGSMGSTGSTGSTGSGTQNKNQGLKLLTLPADLTPEGKGRRACAFFTNTKKRNTNTPSIPESPTTMESRLLTLAPPIASKPAALAAINAARIATRYNFSLVYVVNLWPTSADPMATPTRGSRLSVADTSIRLTGRLLAAYGLECVQSPFRISSVVHSKILQADDWIEYRCPEINPEEFSQGYACSFYTGQYGRRKSEGDAKPSSSSRDSTRKNIDRGIVFAAYRKPSKDKARKNYSKAELEELHDDAEALVELLLDTHFMSSLQNASMFAQHFEETGPMPAHTPQIHA